MSKKHQTIDQKIAHLRLVRGVVGASSSLIAVVIGVLLTMSFNKNVSSAERDAIATRITNSSREVKKSVVSCLDHWEEDFFNLGLYLGAASGDSSFDVDQSLKAFSKEGDLESFGLLYSDGFYFPGETKFASDSSYFSQIDLTHPDSLYLGTVGGKDDTLFVSVAHQDAATGALGYVMKLPISSFQKRMETSIYNGRAFFALFDASGNPIVVSSKETKEELKYTLSEFASKSMTEEDGKQFLQNIKDRKEGIVLSSPKEGPCIGFYSPLSSKEGYTASSPSSWTFIMSAPTSELTSQLQSVSTAGFVSFLISLSITIGVLIAFIVTDTQKSIRVIRNGSHDPITGLLYSTSLNEECLSLLEDNPNSKYALVGVSHEDYRLFSHLYTKALYVRLQRQAGDVINGFIVPKKEAACRHNASTALLLLQYESLEELQKRIRGLDSSLQNMKLGEITSFRFTYGIKEIVERSNPNIPQETNRAIFALEQTGIGANESKIVVFDDEMYREEMDAETMEERAPSALRSGEFEVFFQAKYCLRENRFCGCEALARWHVDGRLIGPTVFIPIFERNGFVNELDEWVLANVCSKIRNSLSRGEKVLPISINVSKEHFKDPHFIETYSSIVSRYNVPHDLIEFELTESITAENLDLLKNFLAIAHKDGFLVAMDDFGSGYSSLNLIKELDFDIIKLDCRFFNGSNRETAYLIIESLIELCHKLGKRVVAEGIEDQEFVDFLRKCDCDQIQGFIFSMPSPYVEYVASISKEDK